MNTMPSLTPAADNLDTPTQAHATMRNAVSAAASASQPDGMLPLTQLWSTLPAPAAPTALLLCMLQEACSCWVLCCSTCQMLLLTGCASGGSARVRGGWTWPDPA